MPYATLEDVLVRYRPISTMIGSGAYDVTSSEVASVYIAQTEAYIDARLSQRYLVPFSIRSPLVTQIASDLSIFFMLAEKMPNVPDFMDKRRARAEDLLDSLANGELTISSATIVTSGGDNFAWSPGMGAPAIFSPVVGARRHLSSYSERSYSSRSAAAPAAPAAPSVPGAVDSVAGRTGSVVLSASDISNFSVAAAAAAPVQTVAGRTGAVTLGADDISGFDFSAAAAAPVQSVVGRTGAVTLTTSDISGFNVAVASVASGFGGSVLSVASKTGAVTLTTTDISGFSAAVTSAAFAAAPVLSVASKTGAVTLTTTDISGFSAAVTSAAFAAAPVLSVASKTGAVSLVPTDIASFAGAAAAAAPVLSVASKTGAVSLTPTDIASFAGAAAAAAPVLSVASKTGAVTLVTSDVSGAAPLAAPALTGAATLLGQPIPNCGSGARDPTTTDDVTQGFITGISNWFNTATGIFWHCYSSTTNAAVWLALSPSRHPGYVSGKWYGTYASASTNTAFPVNTLFASPLLIENRVTITTLGFYLSTAATAGGATAALAKLGIYSNSGGRPGTLLAECTADIDLTTGQAKTVTIPSTTLNPGVYWVGMVSQGTNVPNIVGWSSTSIGGAGFVQYVGGEANGAFMAGGLAINRLVRTAALTYVAGSAFLPSTFGATTASNGTPGSPVINFQVP